MRNLIQAELLKLRTTRSFWLYLAAALAFVPVTVALAVTGASAGLQGGTPLGSSDGVRNVFGSAAGGTLMLLLIGIYMMAGEFRHNTATSTFLITPDRRRVVGAKLAASGFVGFVVGVAASVVTLAIALPWLSAKDVDLAATHERHRCGAPRRAARDDAEPDRRRRLRRARDRTRTWR